MTPDEHKALAALSDRWSREARDSCDHLEGGVYSACAEELETFLATADEERVPLTADQVTRDALESCRRDREALTRRIQEEREAMEQLASEWEQGQERAAACARDPVIAQRAQTYLNCARELRARLKP